MFEKGRCTLLIKVECWLYKDSCWVEVSLATLTCWGYYQVLNIGVFLLYNTNIVCQPVSL